MFSFCLKKQVNPRSEQQTYFEHLFGKEEIKNKIDELFSEHSNLTAHYKKTSYGLEKLGNAAERNREVKIFSAKGLMAADIGGKSDPYTVLELDNLRRQTHIEYKTIAPVWNRVLVMKVTDIHSVLHVTVFDDDRNHRYV